MYSIKQLGIVPFAVLWVSLPVQSHALTPAEVFDQVKDSIFVVKTFGTNGKQKALGSAVLLPSGKIATNCHVVKGGTSFQAGRGKTFTTATLFSGDSDKDICLLEAQGIGGTPAQIGKAAGLKVGATVYAVGAPRGLELSLSDGIVSQLRGGPPPIIQTTAAISPGSSGGGLFDGEGRLVGFTTLYIDGGQSLNFAMPVEWLADIKPGVKQASSGRSATDWLARAAALEERKDWLGLLNWCLKWTKAEPTYDFAWWVLGGAYKELKRYSDAIDAYRQVLRINPENTLAWLSLGVSYDRLNRNSDAMDAYRQALRINPEHAVAWFQLGGVYYRINRYNDAIDAIRNGLRVDPENTDAWSNLGLTYDNLNRHSDAIDAYRQALHVNPQNADAWSNLGLTYDNLNRHSDAIDAYRQALRINPEHAVAWFRLGGVYELSGNRTAALEAVQTLRRLDPDKAEVLFNFIVPR